MLPRRIGLGEAQGGGARGAMERTWDDENSAPQGPGPRGRLRKFDTAICMHRISHSRPPGKYGDPATNQREARPGVG